MVSLTKKPQSLLSFLTQGIALFHHAMSYLRHWDEKYHNFSFCCFKNLYLDPKNPEKSPYIDSICRIWIYSAYCQTILRDLSVFFCHSHSCTYGRLRVRWSKIKTCREINGHLQCTCGLKMCLFPPSIKIIITCLLRKYFFRRILIILLKVWTFICSCSVIVLVKISVDEACNICLTWWLTFEW